jgi:hypothetical protein
MASVLVALILLPPIAAGLRPEPDHYKAALIFVGMFSLIAASLYSTRVTVTDREITIWTWFILRHSVPFDEIDHSHVQYLAEADWPVALTIYSRGRGHILGRIGLKAVTKEDAAWISALPQLKPVVHPGLTKPRV